MRGLLARRGSLGHLGVSGAVSSHSKIVAGYLPTWVSLTLRAVPSTYDLVTLAFATIASDGTASFANTDSTLASTITSRKAAGKLTLLSIGGANGTVANLSTTAQQNAFYTSITAIIDQYGFDGIDWDIEADSTLVGGINPAGMEAVTRRLITRYGANFAITLAPAGGIVASYQTLATNIKDILTYVGFQFYDNGSAPTASYVQSTMESWMSTCGITEQQLLMGFMHVDDNSVTTSYATMSSIYQSVAAAHPGVRGADVWTIATDQADSYQFVNTMSPVIHPAAQRVAVPAYFFPTYSTDPSSPTAYWQRMETNAPYVEFAVANPASGPGTSQDTYYATQIVHSQGQGLLVLGYVDTSYFATQADPNNPFLVLNRTVASVEADIDKWYQFYPSIDGIFLDQASNDPAQQSKYQALYDYIKAKTGLRRVVINPGVATDESYMTACDVVMSFELTPYEYRTRAAAAWEVNYPASRFWHCVYGINPVNGELDEMIALSRTNRAGYIMLTTDALSNPYDTLPDDPFWSHTVAAVRTPSTTTLAPAVTAFSDTFSGFAIDTSRWFVAGSPALAVDATANTNRLRITGHSTYADAVNSQTTYSLVGRMLSAQVPTVTTSASGEQFLQAFVDVNNYIGIGMIGTNLVLRKALAGTVSDTTVAYSATSHAWWRLKDNAGTVTWETSPDGLTWTVQRTLASGLPTLTAAYIRLYVAHATAGDPDQFTDFDNVSLIGI